MTGPQEHLKDERLDGLAERANVAQFVSFGPGPTPAQRFCRIRGYESGHPFASLEEAIDTLLSLTIARTVNVRSFQPTKTKGGQFDYGLRARDEIVALLRSHAQEGLYTIVNETIDVHDGGVSGVALNGVVEFAPDDTPRCVEKPGVASFERSTGLHLLRTVYGFEPDLDYKPEERVEFSIHPSRVGLRRSHTLVWEIEEVGDLQLTSRPTWPNRFSRLVGDKVFGLLVAQAVGLRVPSATVVSRRLSPFSFGRSPGTGDVWLRTAPMEQIPGHFPTFRGWRDPFSLMQEIDPDGTAVPSVLVQESVDAAYSGATVPQDRPGDHAVEGVAGFGDAFMLGREGPGRLPAPIVADVEETVRLAEEALGPVRLEWAHDREGVWVLQLHQVGDGPGGGTASTGDASRWHEFDAGRGLDDLRELIEEVAGTGEGVLVRGDVGITSHIGDVLRKAGVPARIEQGPPGP